MRLVLHPKVHSDAPNPATPDWASDGADLRAGIALASGVHLDPLPSIARRPVSPTGPLTSRFFRGSRLSGPRRDDRDDSKSSVGV